VNERWDGARYLEDDRGIQPKERLHRSRDIECDRVSIQMEDILRIGEMC
jgi:hypothetical protein